MDKSKYLSETYKATGILPEEDVNQFIREQLTGLNLGANNLSELPSTFTRLTSLRELQLNFNPFNDRFPMQVCSLTLLTNLELVKCGLTSLPQEISQLQQLEHLDCSFNKLSILPSGLVNLTRLTRLRWDSNELKTLDSIGALTTLRELYLAANHLKEIPVSITQLTQLEDLWLNYNQLKSVPLDLAKLPKLRRLLCWENPFVSPFESLRKYPGGPANWPEYSRSALQLLRACAEEGIVPYRQIKLIFIGNGGEGKSTLLKSLKEESKLLSSLRKPKQVSVDQSTVGVDITSLGLSPTSSILSWKKIDYTAWDFAGQMEYSTLHPFFLSATHSVYLLVVNISEEINHVQKSMDYWLNYLQRWNILPHSTSAASSSNQLAIIVVGTQKDKLFSSPQQSAQQHDPQKRLTALQTLFNQYQSDGRINDWIIVSGMKIEGIGELIEKINQHSARIVDSESLLLPRLVSKLVHVISTLLRDTSVNPLLTLDEFMQLVQFKPFENYPLGIDQTLSLLHNVGSIVYRRAVNKQTQEEQRDNQNQTEGVVTEVKQLEGMICLRPTLLIKMMASFICPDNHLAFLFGKEIPIQSIPADAILTHSDLKQRIQIQYQKNKHNNTKQKADSNNNNNTLPEVSLETTVNRLMELMENFSFYYALNDQEQQLYRPANPNHNHERCYLFPSLRPNNGKFYLHRIATTSVDPHYTLAIRYSRIPTTTTTSSTTSTEMTEFIPPSLFFQLQVATRKYHNDKIYGNIMKLTSSISSDKGQPSNDAWILPNRHNTHIDVIIQGDNPITFFMEIHSLVQNLSDTSDSLTSGDIKLKISSLCPDCIVESVGSESFGDLDDQVVKPIQGMDDILSQFLRQEEQLYPQEEEQSSDNNNNNNRNDNRRREPATVVMDLKKKLSCAGKGHLHTLQEFLFGVASFSNNNNNMSYIVQSLQRLMDSDIQMKRRFEHLITTVKDNIKE